MRRAEGWETRLRHLIDDMRGVPFAWGSHDCCTFAVADYEAMLGEPPPKLPAWADYTSAQQLVADRALGDWLNDIVGAPLDGWAWARRGDLVLIAGKSKETPHGELIGVVGGSMICCLSMSGVAFLPLNRGIRTWRIGE